MAETSNPAADQPMDNDIVMLQGQGKRSNEDIDKEQAALPHCRHCSSPHNTTQWHALPCGVGANDIRTRLVMLRGIAGPAPAPVATECCISTSTVPSTRVSDISTQRHHHSTPFSDPNEHYYPTTKTTLAPLKPSNHSSTALPTPHHGPALLPSPSPPQPDLNRLTQTRRLQLNRRQRSRYSRISSRRDLSNETRPNT